MKTGFQLFLLALVLFLPSRAAQSQERGCEKRQLPVFVTEKDGSLVTTLDSPDFRLQSRSASMSLVALNHDERRHRVVILLDVSNSMRGLVGPPLWPVVMALARHATHAGGENSDLALALFSDHVLETVGFSPGRDAVWHRLEEVAQDPALPMLPKANDSRIYDALKETAKTLGNPAFADSLLVITDGGDEGSKSKPDEILDLLSTSMTRVFAILVDPLHGQASSMGPEALLRIVQKSGGRVFGPIDSDNAAFRKSGKTAEAQKMMEEQLTQFYQGIFANDVLTIQAASTIHNREVVDLSLTEFARHKIKGAHIYFPHGIGPCSNIGSSQ